MTGDSIKKYLKQANKYINDYKHLKTSENKICPLHKINSHSYSECRVLRKQSERKKNSEETPKKTYTIKKSRCAPKTLEIPMEINNKTFNGLIDTGSVENYILEGLSSQMNLPTTTLPRKKFTEVGNGDQVDITRRD
ncbi:hypothetical protein EQH57_0125 [Dictyocoela roeselum]|nr:hypothetical protein EQH57_0125 [Dictyocoela roeselum]